MWFWHLIAALAALCTVLANPLPKTANLLIPVKRRYICPDRFVRHGNSCYYFSTHMASWHEAHYACQDMGSDLARLEKRWEDRNMRVYLNKPEFAPLERWIGGIYNWEMHQWIWGATGKKLGYQGFSRRSPNDNPSWHCIILDPSMFYKWGMRNCYQKKHYICETPLVWIKPPQPSITSPVEKPKRKKERGDGKRRGKERIEGAVKGREHLRGDGKLRRKGKKKKHDQSTQSSLYNNTADRF